VGKVTTKKLRAIGIETCSQLQALTLNEVTIAFGKFGNSLYNYCRGIDERLVETSRARKSVSVEHTYLQDLIVLSECETKLITLYEDLVKRLEKYKHRKLHKQFIKVKFSDFEKEDMSWVIFFKNVRFLNIKFLDELYSSYEDI
jgi:DNA polymerase-4